MPIPKITIWIWLSTHASLLHLVTFSRLRSLYNYSLHSFFTFFPQLKITIHIY